MERFQNVADLGPTYALAFCGGYSVFTSHCRGREFCYICTDSANCTKVKERSWYGSSIRKGPFSKRWRLRQELADRPDVTASLALVIPGNSAPPLDLKAMFRQWRDQAWPFNASEVLSMDLDHALETLEKERFTIKELQSEPLPLGVDADRLEVTSLYALVSDNSIS